MQYAVVNWISCLSHTIIVDTLKLKLTLLQHLWLTLVDTGTQLHKIVESSYSNRKQAVLVNHNSTFNTIMYSIQYLILEFDTGRISLLQIFKSLLLFKTSQYVAAKPFATGQQHFQNRPKCENKRPFSLIPKTPCKIVETAPNP